MTSEGAPPDSSAEPKASDQLAQLWGWAMRHGIAALTLAGVLAYALGRSCYIVFYGQLGISPDEVGIDQARSVEAAGLLLAAFAALVLIADSAVTFMGRGGWWWPLGFALQWPYLLVAVRVVSLGDDGLITGLALLALYAGLSFLPQAIGVARGLRKRFLRHLNLPGPYALVACLTLIIGGSLTVAWQYGAKAASTGAFSALPFSAIRIDPVCVSGVIRSAPTAGIRRERVYGRLGSADGTLVLYDSESRGVTRLPAASVAMTTPRNVHGRKICPTDGA